MSGGYALVGRIRKPHGIHGDLVVEAICDNPASVFAPGRPVFVGDTRGAPESDAPRSLTVLRSRPFKQGWLVALRSIDDRNEAELWRGRYLLCPESELAPLAEGEVWVHELVGMRVIDVGGAAVGDVRDVSSLPQGLMLELDTPRGRASVPFVDAIVTHVDRAARTVTIDPPAGLLEL